MTARRRRHRWRWAKHPDDARPPPTGRSLYWWQDPWSIEHANRATTRRRRSHRDANVDPETLERPGWPDQTPERAAEVSDRAGRARARSRFRQSRDRR